MEEISSAGDGSRLFQDDNEITHADGGQPEVSAEIFLYLTFQLGRDLFGIRVSSIREVIEYKKVFKTPRVPDYIRGVINLRGEVVPIIDLMYRFYRKKNGIQPSTAIVVIEVDEDSRKVPVGVMIDAVRAVAEIYKDDIEATPEIGSKIRSDFLDGIGRVNDEFVILLNICNILNIGELAAMEEKIN